MRGALPRTVGPADATYFSHRGAGNSARPPNQTDPVPASHGAQIWVANPGGNHVTKLRARDSVEAVPHPYGRGSVWFQCEMTRISRS
jgi:hypothetical protein